MENKIGFLQSELDLSDIANSFSRSLQDVTCTMSGFEFTEADITTSDNKPLPGQITGAMLLLGEKSSLFSLSLSKQTCLELVSFMTGISPIELTDEDLKDGVMELTNMVAGRSKLILSDTPNSFKLTSPFAICGDNTTITHKSKVAQLCKNYQSGNMVITMNIFFL